MISSVAHMEVCCKETVFPTRVLNCNGQRSSYDKKNCMLEHSVLFRVCDTMSRFWFIYVSLVFICVHSSIEPNEIPEKSSDAAFTLIQMNHTNRSNASKLVLIKPNLPSVNTSIKSRK